MTVPTAPVPASATPPAGALVTPSPVFKPGRMAWVRTALRWAFILACVFAIGPLASMPLAGVRDVDGGQAVTMLTGGNAGPSLAGGLVVVLASLVVGAVGAWCFSAGTGLACAGLVMGWGAWRMGTIDDVLRRTRDGDALAALALENGLVVLLAGVITLVIGWFTMRRQSSAPPQGGRIGLLALLATDARRKGSLPVAAFALGAGTLAGGVAAYFGAATMDKGQAVFAAFLGGVAAGVVSHLVARGQNGNVSPALVVVCGLVPALAGPIVAQAIHGSKLIDASFAGSLFPLSRVVSLDWACGLLLGAPVGLGWAGAMLDERSADQA